MVNAVNLILVEKRKRQRLSTFVNAPIFMDVIDNTHFMFCQQCHVRNTCILFFQIVCLG